MNAVSATTAAVAAGVVYFGNNGVNGNDNNAIDHCNIHSSGTGASIPSMGVYALGANNTGINSNFNDNDTISDCNIYDYFLVNGNSAGVLLNNGVNNWVVSGNHFFQTDTRTYSAAGFNRGVWVVSNRNTGSAGNGFLITGNYIGGAAPACTGTPYTLSAWGNSFDGIRLEIADGVPVNPSSVQGNTITNMAITSTITSDIFHGIALTITTSTVSPANAAAAPVALVTDDIDGETRDAATPDIGADEFKLLNGIDMQAVSLETPVAGKGCYGKEAAAIKVRNNSSVPIDFSVNPVTVTVNVTGAATATVTKILTTGTLAAGATMDVLLNGAADSIDMSAAGTYVFAAKTTTTGDVKLLNDAISVVTRTKAALASGTVSASQTSFCFNGAPVLTVTGGDGFSGIQWQQSADSAVYSNIAGAGVSPYTTTAATQTLYYRLGSVCITDTVFTPAVKVVINSPAITATTPAARCNAGVVNLQATGSAGSTLYWYPDAAATSPVDIGSTYTTPAIAATTTYYVLAVAGSCETPRTAVVATVNNRIAIDTQPSSQGVCMGSAVTLHVAANGSAVSYQWRKNGVNIANATTDTYSIANAVGADAGAYDVVLTNPCGVVVSNVASLAVRLSNNWLGAVSSDWNTAANWCGGVPVATTDVSIDAGTPFSPVIDASSNAHTITIGTGAALAINGTGMLNLYGNFVNAGMLIANTGTIAFVGTASQTTTSLSVGNVVLNGAGVVLNGNMTINNMLTMSNGNITTGLFNIYLQHATGGSIASHIVTYNGVTWALVSPAGGVLPTGSSTARQVALSTTQLGSIVLANQGMLKAPVYEFTVQLLPTMVTGSKAKLRITSKRTMTMTWTVIDATGTLTKKFTTSMTAGVNDFNVSLAGLASGVYMLRGVGDDGRIQTIRFIIKH